ncbi:MAG: hypothetical protein ABFD13_06005 [Candidatus Cryosericum sp.]|nr:hypothetical protein [bacterium]
MKTVIRILVVLLAVLIVAAGVAWYMLGHGGQQQTGTQTPAIDLAPARQLLSDLKANSNLKFSIAVPNSFDWYVANGQNTPTKLTLPGVVSVASPATSDDAVWVDTWLRQQGFIGDAQNNGFGDTSVAEGYIKGSLVVLVVTPIATSGATTEATQLAVYAGVLPSSPAAN